MEEWMQYAKDMAKAEKELKIEQWVIISFYRVTERGEKGPGHTMAEGKTDLPVSQRKGYVYILPV